MAKETITISLNEDDKHEYRVVVAVDEVERFQDSEWEMKTTITRKGGRVETIVKYGSFPSLPVTWIGPVQAQSPVIVTSDLYVDGTMKAQLSNTHLPRIQGNQHMAFAAPPLPSLDSKAVCVGAGLAREFANFRRRGSVVKAAERIHTAVFQSEGKVTPIAHLIAEYYFHPDSIIRWMGRNQQEATGQMTRILQPLQNSDALLTPFAGCDAKAAHYTDEQKSQLSCCLLVLDSHPGNESWRRGLVVGGQVRVEIFIVRSGAAAKVEAQRDNNDSVDLLWKARLVSFSPTARCMRSVSRNMRMSTTVRFIFA